MRALPPCPRCHSRCRYANGGMSACPRAQGWDAHPGAATADDARNYRDSAGNRLQDGDTVIKDLKRKGSGGTVRMGTKVKHIRRIDNDHDLDCKIDDFGRDELEDGVCQESVMFNRMHR